jgi:hypothetical protein
MNDPAPRRPPKTQVKQFLEKDHETVFPHPAICAMQVEWPLP